MFRVNILQINNSESAKLKGFNNAEKNLNVCKRLKSIKWEFSIIRKMAVL